MQSLLSSRVARFQIHLICVIIEPLRLLHQYFLLHAHSHANDVDLAGDERKPAIHSLMEDRSSIVHHVLQYYSSMLGGAADRLCLVWMLGGHNSMDEWQEACPDESLCVRRLILHAASWVWRRLRNTLQSWQFKLLLLGDPAQPQAHAQVSRYENKHLHLHHTWKLTMEHPTSMLRFRS
jgi:hypothetical protein